MILLREKQREQDTAILLKYILTMKILERR